MLQCSVDGQRGVRRSSPRHVSKATNPAICQHHDGLHVIGRPENMSESVVGDPALVGPIVFPDPLTSTHLVSAATFLYFDTPVKLPSPIWIPDEEAYGLHELVARRHPEWAARFFQLDSLYGEQVDAWKRTREIDPLSDAFTGTLYAFDADSDALNEGVAFLEATGETMEEAGAKIDIGAAAGEVFHHLLIDKYFELDQDLDVLFEYCGEFLAAPSPVSLLVSCYLPRLMLTPRVARARATCCYSITCS